MTKRIETLRFKKKRYKDMDTDEIVEASVITKQVDNHSFEMIFYGHLVDVLDDIGNAKIKVLKELIKNKTKAENMYIGGNIASLARNAGVSYPTASEVVKVLKNRGLLTAIGGSIILNPDMICDGRFKKRIMHEYCLAEGKQEEKEAEKKRREKEKDNPKLSLENNEL